MIKAVIFDMDGVIVDSSHIHIEAEKQTMLKYGIRISSKELHKYTGMTAKFMFTELIKKYKLNTTFEEIFDEKEKILFKLLEQDTRPTKLKISHLFDCIVSSEDITHSKPNPEIFLKSANELSVSPTDCLVIEDAKLGVEAAKNAGMKCVGYINPKSGNQDLSEADIVIDDFSKLDIKELF